MRFRSSARLSLALYAFMPHLALADTIPVRSSVNAQAQIDLTDTSEYEEADTTESQSDTLLPIGPVIARATIDSSDGFYRATTTGVAGFVDADRGSFEINQSYSGSIGTGDIEAERFGHVLNGTFEYDFIVQHDGILNLSGVMLNGGPSSISYFGFIQVFHESEVGEGFEDAFFQLQLFDFTFDSEPFDLDIPLTEDSGSYRIQFRLGHIGLGQLNSPLSSGSLNGSWIIQAENPCPADLTGDGSINLFDVSAFLNAFVNQDPIADFAPDGVFNFFDVSLFILELNAGCP
jgi:hypothetical protein